MLRIRLEMKGGLVEHGGDFLYMRPFPVDAQLIVESPTPPRGDRAEDVFDRESRDRDEASPAGQSRQSADDSADYDGGDEYEREYAKYPPAIAFGEERGAGHAGGRTKRFDDADGDHHGIDAPDDDAGNHQQNRSERDEDADQQGEPDDGAQPGKSDTQRVAESEAAAAQFLHDAVNDRGIGEGRAGEPDKDGDETADRGARCAGRSGNEQPQDESRREGDEREPDEGDCARQEQPERIGQNVADANCGRRAGLACDE